MTVPTFAGEPSGHDEAIDPDRPVYLDCNATTPIEPRVQVEVLRYMAEEFGNAGSRTHTYGQRAKERVNRAREEVAAVVDAKPEEVIFTSGATESNNLALLGLASHGEDTGRRHIVSTQIEHKAVLEPLEELQRRGFDVTYVPPTTGGWVDPEAIRAALRSNTLLVSVMAVNNETGVIQSLDDIAGILEGHDAFLHADGAQAFGKTFNLLKNRRIDLLSVSGHKIHAPKGIGALVTRRRGYSRPPLKPLLYGGGQERGLRPGTLPVALIAGFGLASDLAIRENSTRSYRVDTLRRQALDALSSLDITYNGDMSRTARHTLNFSIKSVDSEAAIVALKHVAAISNGSACTSNRYQPSHVLHAAGLPDEQIAGALRLSWSHLTSTPPWATIVDRLRHLNPR